MIAKALVLTSLLATAFTAYSLAGTGSGPAEEVAGATVDVEPTVTELVFEGFARNGALVHASHVVGRPPVLPAFDRMSFLLDVPQGTEALAFDASWPAGATLHMLVVAPAEDSHVEWSGPATDEGGLCLSIPEDGLVAGTWRVAAHTPPETTDLEFVVRVILQGPAGASIGEDAGNRMVGGPYEGHEHEEREPEPC